MRALHSDRSEPDAMGVVTVLYGGEATLESTMPTWQRVAATGVEFVFVDHSPEPLDQQLGLSSWGKYYWDPSNPGFAAGANRAVRMSSTAQVLLLNPDVYLSVEEFSRIRRHADGGIGAVRLQTGEQETTGIEYTWYGFCRDRRGGDRPLVGPSGGAAVIERDLVASIGNLPEHLFAWGEDAEWALLMYARGYRTRAIPVTLRHVGGHSVASKRGQLLKARLLVRNRIATYRRVLSRPTQALIAAPFFTAILLNGVRKLVHGVGLAYFRGVLEGLTMAVPPLDQPRVSWRVWRELTKRKQARVGEAGSASPTDATPES